MKSSKSQSNEKILLFGHLTSKLGDIIFDYANKIVLVSAFASLLKMEVLVGLSLLFIPIAALSGNLLIGLIPYLLFSMTLAMYNINFMSYIQTSVDEAFQGRVFSVIFAFIMIFMPVGSFFFSAINVTKDIRSFYIPGVGIIIVAIVCLIINRYLNSNDDERKNEI